MARIIAFLLLLIPGILSAVGIKLMRDAIFNEYYGIFLNSGLQFIISCTLFLGGLSFIAGFIFHRDRKKHSIRKEQKPYKKNHTSSHTPNR